MADFDNDAELVEDKYGVLIRNLQAYFPTVDDPEDKSGEFIQEYRLVGEQNIRFSGLEDQLKEAIKRPSEFSRVLNQTMGYDLTSAQTGEYMIDLYNRLTGVDETKVRAKQDTDALMSYYLRRTVKIPFKVPYFGENVPLWAFLVVSTLVAGLGWLGFTFLKVPVVEQFFLFVLVVGVLGMTFSAFTMYFLRDEVVNSERYEQREVALKQYREAKKQKRSASRWRLPTTRR